MPIFEYSCEACGAGFEKLHLAPVSEADPVRCPGCGQTRVTRRHSTFAPRSGAAARRARPAPSRPAGGGCCTPGSCGCH